MTEQQDNTAPALLIESADAIGARADQRDTPEGERSMGRAVTAFNAIYGTRLTEEMGWQFMAILKISRSAGGRRHRDDYIDQAAYAGLAGEAALHGLLHPDVGRIVIKGPHER